MKKLFLALVVCAGFCACSNDDVVVTSNPGDYSREAAAYLTVNIKDVNSGTRATDGGYKYGDESEQKVSNAYFYFYDDNGKYKAYGTTGSITGTAETEEGQSGPYNIEWNSGTLVAVYGLDADLGLPTRMLTVLNKPSNIDLKNISLDSAVATLAGAPYDDGNGNFVMTTSVYYSSGIINYTALKESDFAVEPYALETDYPSGGVDVYVERLAAKVQVIDSATPEDGYIEITSYVASDFPNGAPEGGVFVSLDGFDVNGVARDAYLVKQITGNWANGAPFNGWNVADNYRCYWAMSPNYGVAEVEGQMEYPTSSNGNDPDAEANAATWLNEYLRYVNLAEPVAMGGATYCGENTNTVGTNGVIKDIDSSALTNVLVKGTVYTVVEDEYVPLDLVEFHGMYYTVDDFLNTTVTDVMNYDFTVMVDEVITALKATLSDTFASYLDDLKAAVMTEAVYTSGAVENHNHENGTPSAVTPFDGSMLSLYSIKDGYVDLFFKDAQPYWGTSGLSDGTPVGAEIIAKYPASDIVYGGKSLEDYEFWFHLDYNALEPLERLGLTTLGLMVQIGDAYYMPIDNSVSFTSSAIGDDNDTSFTGNHPYTLRNYFLRAITVEADGIDTQFGSHYPNLYNGGAMYYHVPIEHLATNSSQNAIVEAEYGVVRNHWYNITVTSVTDFGRGIADVNEVIVPLPEVDYYYLGADINILSWKMVNQTVGF